MENDKAEDETHFTLPDSKLPDFERPTWDLIKLMRDHLNDHGLVALETLPGYSNSAWEKAIESLTKEGYIRKSSHTDKQGRTYFEPLDL